MNASRFINVLQRRPLTLEASLLEEIEPLFMIETHMSMEERLGVLQAGLALAQNFVACEVGSYVGASACFLAVAARRRNGHIHCVDTWDNRAMDIEVPRDTLGEFRRNTKPFEALLTIHRGTSASIGSQIPNNLDLLLLDGDHAYEAVQADLQAYAAKLKPSGVLLFHDYDYEGVRRAADEWLGKVRFMDAGAAGALKAFQVG